MRCAAAGCDQVGIFPIELVLANRGATTVHLCQEHHAAVQEIPNYRITLRRDAIPSPKDK
jgi:hypothetical protein